MTFLLTTLAARQCLTFNPPSDDQFDSALLSAPVLLQCLSREQIAKSAEDKLKELTSSARSMTEVLIQAESSNISVSSRLSAYRKESGNRRPDFAKAYDELVERLNAIDRGQVGPPLGEFMPEFDLPDESGRLMSLSSLLQSGPVVISINRGHWCPYCKLELRSLAAIHNEIKQLGARMISIMPDSAQFTSGYVAQNDLPFPVLSDIDLGYSLSLGLIFWIGAEIQKLYEEAGVELEKYHGNHGYFLPMAAKFIVGSDGRVKARQVNIEFRERMEPDAIVAVLRELSGD